MASPQTFAQKMVAALEAAMLKNVGVGQVTVDGQTVMFASTAELTDLYFRWKRAAGIRRRTSTFDLS